jgi:hypothetical protein
MTDAEEEVLEAIDAGMEGTKCDIFKSSDAHRWLQDFRKSVNRHLDGRYAGAEVSRQQVSAYLRALSQKGWIKKHKYGQWVRRKLD